MNVADILSAGSVLCNAQARSKKHCLEILSELLVRPFPDLAVEHVFGKLIERERLGCTSLDLGVAFPHCRVNSIEVASAAMIKLANPVDFDAADGEPVDLVFGLIVPQVITAEHHDYIREIADMLKSRDWRADARSATKSSELFAVVTASDTLTGDENKESEESTDNA